MRERKLVERAVRISGMFVLLSGMGLQPCLASHSYNAASAGVVQVEQQKQKITGCVLDVTGSPLPGASVLVKGAPGRGAITDMDGNFSVEAEQGEQLEISFIGMETQVVTVSAKTRLQITLKEDSKTLDEVVVVGYGTQKKANLTGAVASVSAETLESRPITNLSQGLQGMIGNLNISADNGAPGKGRENSNGISSKINRHWCFRIRSFEISMPMSFIVSVPCAVSPSPSIFLFKKGRLSYSLLFQ